MTHIRTQIRNHIADTALLSLAGSTGNNEIYKNRSRPVTEYPSISVYNGNERTDVENPGRLNEAKRYWRFQDYIIEVAVTGNDDPDTELDDLCSAIETAMDVDETMAISLLATDLINTSFSMSGVGTEALHVALLTYRCEYRTTAANPEQALN